MFEIAGVIILLALIVIVLVIALLPQFLWPLVIALWVAAIAVALIAGLVGLWSEMGPATFLILIPNPGSRDSGQRIPESASV